MNEFRDSCIIMTFLYSSNCNCRSDKKFILEYMNILQTYFLRGNVLLRHEFRAAPSVADAASVT